MSKHNEGNTISYKQKGLFLNHFHECELPLPWFKSLFCCPKIVLHSICDCSSPGSHLNCQPIPKLFTASASYLPFTHPHLLPEVLCAVCTLRYAKVYSQPSFSQSSSVPASGICCCLHVKCSPTLVWTKYAGLILPASTPLGFLLSPLFCLMLLPQMFSSFWDSLFSKSSSSWMLCPHPLSSF